MHFISGDRVFLFIVATIALIGFAIFTSATLGFLARGSVSVSQNILIQAGLGLGLGFVAFIIGRAISLKLINVLAPYLFIASLIFTALVFIPGVGLTAGGATRWINLQIITVQPAEFLKIGFVIMLASWLAPRARSLSSFRIGLLPLVALIAVPVFILLAQPNTSTAFLIIITAVTMYYVAGGPWRDIGILFAISIFVLVAIVVIRPYALERVTTLINPSANALDEGYHIQQSLIAIGSGELLGRGFGQSIKKFTYLPEPDGDSVFSVYAEETGFIGAIVLIALFIGLAARGIVIAGNSHNLFGGLIAFGFSFLIILQAFTNIGSMIGIIPLTGLPLPFISSGGTALVAVFFMTGLILNVAAHKGR